MFKNTLDIAFNYSMPRLARNANNSEAFLGRLALGVLLRILAAQTVLMSRFAMGSMAPLHCRKTFCNSVSFGTCFAPVPFGSFSPTCQLTLLAGFTLRRLLLGVLFFKTLGAGMNSELGLLCFAL